MRKTQRKILGAMLILSDEEMTVDANLKTISLTAGYKQPGGALTHAIEFLERDNKIARKGDGTWVITL